MTRRKYFFQTLKASAVGDLLKKAAASDLIAAIEAASRGEPYLYPQIERRGRRATGVQPSPEHDH